MAQTNSRLSPYGVEDDLLRASLYKEIRQGSPGWTQYEIQPGDVGFPELIAHRVYGTADMKWVVLIAAKIDSMRNFMDSGEVLLLPPVAWVRERIKHYHALELIPSA